MSENASARSHERYLRVSPHILGGVIGLANNTESETRLALYLLGDVSIGERELLEAEYFSDDEAFQKMLSAEDDLIDAYARGELSTEHRQLFEKRFLNSAEGRERLQFARMLAGAVAEEQSVVVSEPEPIPLEPVLIPDRQPGFWATLWNRSPALSFAVIILAIVLIGGNTALLVERRNTRNEMEALRAERDRLNQQAAALKTTVESEQARSNQSAEQIRTLQEQLAQVSGQRPKESPAKSPENKTNPITEQSDPRFRDTIAQNRPSEFTVYPGTLRGTGGRNNFTLPKAAQFVSLKLVVENRDAAKSYNVAIETADGARVKSFDVEATSANVINLPRVAASELPSGVYVITLQGKQADGSFRKIADYAFNLVKK